MTVDPKPEEEGSRCGHVMKAGSERNREAV